MKSFFLILALSLSAPQANATAKQQAEQNDREVDQVALQAQESAISKLKILLTKYKGHQQEAMLLFKLAEDQNQAAAIRFRIAHGQAGHSGQSLNVSAYKKAMNESIETLNRLLTLYPNTDDSSKAHFMRAKAYEEIENKPKAANDYLYVVHQFPDSEDNTAAYMALSEFAVDANDHPLAIRYLNEVEKRPNDPQYPFALYKLAWSHYNLKNIAQALAYAEKHIAYYDLKFKTESKEAGSTLATADQSFRENMLLDSTVFYFEGYEENLSPYSVSDALPYFRRLDSGPMLGKLLSRFAKLLRSHGHELELGHFKDLVLNQETNRPEAIEIVLTVFENQVNRREFTALLNTTADIHKLYKANPKCPGFAQAQKLLLDTASNLQDMIVKNKNADGVTSLSHVLAGIYDGFTQIVADSDPRIPRVHYNLAETLFEIHDFEAATIHYRWIVDHGKWSGNDTAGVADASLKAIGARYEVLHALGLIPNQIQAQSEADSREMISIQLDPRLKEFIAWVDEHIQKTDDPIESFNFEAARCIYANGGIREALSRFEKFTRCKVESKYSIPAASLILDTGIAGHQWEQVNRIASIYLKNTAWKTGAFSDRLQAIAADAYFKMVETQYAAKDFNKTRELFETFLKTYPHSTRLADTLLIAAQTSMKLKDNKTALHYYDRMIKETPNADGISNALAQRAQIEENDYAFGAASRDYTQYLRFKTDDTIRKKALALAWLSNEANLLKDALGSEVICGPKQLALVSDCDHYQALLKLLNRDFTEKSTELAMQKAKRGIEENKTIWAAVALEGAETLSYHERMNAARQVATHWDELEPMTRFTLLPFINASIPRAFSLNRKSMNEIAPLRANPRYITARIDVIKEIESSATKVMKLPWSRIRALVLSEVAGLYLDLARGVQTLRAPKGLSESDLAAYEQTVQTLVIPFEEKGQEMRGKAFDIAARFAIEEDSYSAVSDPYFMDNPSFAQKLKPKSKIQKPQNLSLVLLSELDPNGPWQTLARGKSLDLDSESPAANHVAQAWNIALAKKRWPEVSFFLAEATEKKLYTPTVLALMKAITLSESGARGEALTEVDVLKNDVTFADKKRLVLILLAHSLAALSKERTVEFIKVAHQLMEADEPDLAQKPAIAKNDRQPATSQRPNDDSSTQRYSDDDLGHLVQMAEAWIGS